jgi:lipoprotein-anchoring transpeptidase ErfK/SrfK
VSVPQLPTDELAQAASEAEEDAAADDADAAVAVDEVTGRTTVRAPTATRTRAPGTPCTVTARACADIGARKAWLIDDGQVVRGPVRIMVGDDVDPTPVGTFRVQWKDKEYTSREYLRQMPYSVFFADGGIAFHEGDFNTPSGGCIKLSHADAVAWFNFLDVGDEVQVVRSG